MARKIRILCTAFLKGKIIPWRVLIDKDKVGIPSYCVCICVFFFLESLDLLGLAGVASLFIFCPLIFRKSVPEGGGFQQRT